MYALELSIDTCKSHFRNALLHVLLPFIKGRNAHAYFRILLVTLLKKMAFLSSYIF